MADQKATQLEYYRRNGSLAVYLAACALGETCPKLTGAENLEELFQFCKFHSITALIAMALEDAWKETPPADSTVRKPWQQARDMAVRKNILLNAEREQLLAFLESIGCWYMPLKGSLLQFAYPRFGMRQMSDNDILCDPDMRVQIRDHMLQLGYTCVQFDREHHDEYRRQPVYNFEIHHKLFKPEMAPEFAAYFADIHERSRKDDHNRYGYHLSASDFYIYMICHGCNHFREGGIGLRFLMDVQVFLRNPGEDFDWGYVSAELAKLGLTQFELICRSLAEKLFARPAMHPGLNPEEEALLDIFLSSGAYGTESRLFQQSMEKFRQGRSVSRGRYLVSRIFPSAQYMSVMYPVLKKHGYLLPVLWLWRLAKALLERPGRVLREGRAIVRYKDHQK